MNLTEEILLKEGKMLPVMEHFYTYRKGPTHWKSCLFHKIRFVMLVVIGVM